MSVSHQETDTEAKAGPVWSWHFGGENDLRSGLEEYTAFLEAAGVGKYGAEIGGADESDGKTHMCMARKRAEIDRCIEALPYPWFARLLDLYYRQGMSCENKGWCIVAKRLGLRGDPKSRWDRDTFERQVALAINRLWRTHEDRYQRRT
jgi:hypothetical protein